MMQPITQALVTVFGPLGATAAVVFFVGTVFWMLLDANYGDALDDPEDDDF